jgi:hypothetical protein
LQNIEELKISIDLKFNVAERKDFMNIDVSIISDTDKTDSDKESEKDTAIFIGDGKLDSQREYVKNLAIFILPNLWL